VRGDDPTLRLFLDTNQTAQNARYQELNNLYLQYLGRPTDAGGANYWLNVSGLSFSQIAFQLELTPERRTTDAGRRSFVLQAYRDYLGVEGDPGGVAYWQDRLARGLETFESVAKIF